MKSKTSFLKLIVKLKNMNDYILTKIGDFLKIIWIVILSIFSPISTSIYVLTIFFVLNFFIGFQTDRIVNKKDFSLDKITRGAMLFLLYFAIIFIVNVSLSLYHEDELAVSVPKFFTWVACYWYLVNIFRNAMQIFPESKGLKFFYEFMTIQVLDIIFAKFGLKRKDDEDDGKDKK